MDDTQYQNVVRVLGAMPYVEMDIKYEVVDDEATTVYTAGAIVTVRFSPSFIRINWISVDLLLLWLVLLGIIGCSSLTSIDFIRFGFALMDLNWFN